MGGVARRDLVIAPKNILVATDFGEAALRALRYGGEFARAFRSRLHLLHIADDLALHAVTPVGVPPIDFVPMQAGLEEDARRDLLALAALDDLRGLDVAPVVIRDGQPGRAIVEYARAHDVDLIVIGTHGRGGFADFFLGSVAQRVVRSAPCPVLTVRADEREFVQPDPDANQTAQRISTVR
jgi:nucleotide-binding universal stress UspA family protein